MASDKPGFFAELKRRNVLRAGVLYIGAVWALSQGISQLSGPLHLPDWVTVWFLIACAIGFPFWLAFAWFYEFTSHGIKRESEVAADAPSRHSNARKLDFAIIAVMAVAIALLASGYFVRRHAPASTAAAAIPAQSIAVLPFENLSADKANAYFVDGMQDLILTKLADIGSLKVIARTSTQSYGSHPENLTLVGQQLGVATILEGSVQKAGNEVLINVQLIDAKTDSHIWAESYTRTLDNIFGVEGEVAASIAKSLNAKLTPTEDAELARVMTTNKAAYEAFLRAQYFDDKSNASGDTADMKTTIAWYRKAIAADPQFALAFAYLSQAESALVTWGGGGEDVATLNRQARADAETALQLQPGLADAQLALGMCDFVGNQDYPAAQKAFAAVLATQPDNTDALYWKGYVQSVLGQFEAALASFKQAVALNPRDFADTLWVGITYNLMGRYAEAEDWYQRALALQPDSIEAKTNYAYAILFGSGDIPRALAVVQGDDPALKQVRVYLLTNQRKFSAAIALVASIPDTPDNFGLGYSKANALGGLYWVAGDRASARAWFAKALPEDRAALAKVQGFALAAVWQSVGEDQIGIGNFAAGLAAVAKAEALLEATPNAITDPLSRLSDAQTYAMAGRADLAVPLLEKTLATPGIGNNYSPLMLWLAPAWDPIRHSPQFQALLKIYAKDKPAITYDHPPAASSSPATSASAAASAPATSAPAH